MKRRITSSTRRGGVEGGESFRRSPNPGSVARLPRIGIPPTKRRRPSIQRHISSFSDKRSPRAALSQFQLVVRSSANRAHLTWRPKRRLLSWTSKAPYALNYTDFLVAPVTPSSVGRIFLRGCSIDSVGFAGNDSPSFVFPTAIATKGGATAGAVGTGSGRPAVANKPTFLTGGAGPGGHLSAKRGTEDLDFFIGDEAVAAAAGPGMLIPPKVQAQIRRIWTSLPYKARPDRELGECV